MVNIGVQIGIDLISSSWIWTGQQWIYSSETWPSKKDAKTP